MTFWSWKIKRKQSSDAAPALNIKGTMPNIESASARQRLIKAKSQRENITIESIAPPLDDLATNLKSRLQRCVGRCLHRSLTRGATGLAATRAAASAVQKRRRISRLTLLILHPFVSVVLGSSYAQNASRRPVLDEDVSLYFRERANSFHFHFPVRISSELTAGPCYLLCFPEHVRPSLLHYGSPCASISLVSSRLRRDRPGEPTIFQFRTWLRRQEHRQ
jgi:hypothetical protein